MCDEISVLAKIDEYRWIAICQHGTIHLSWDQTILFMRPNELQKVATMLDRSLADQEYIAQQQSYDALINVQLLAEHKRCFHIWIGAYGLCLGLDEYKLFCLLVGKAICMLPLSMFQETSPVHVEVIANIHKPIEQMKFSIN